MNNIRTIMTTLLLTCIVPALAQSKRYNSALADSLAQWAALDQTVAGPPEKLKVLPPDLRARYGDSVLTLNIQRLKKVLARYGFPGYDLVGEKGSNNFWLMAQHADRDVTFQQLVLKLMSAEVKNKNAAPRNFAYLTDRVMINTGRKQVYGTQVTYKTDSCQAIPKPLRDSLNVNKRRRAIGMEPLETYLNMMSQFHYNINKALYDQRGIHGPKLLIVPVEHR